MRLRNLTLLAIAASAPLCGLAAEMSITDRNAADLDGFTERVFKKVGDVELKLYVLAPPDQATSEARPAIVFFFGGGWKQGNVRQFQEQARYFASRGMVGIRADYRVQSRHGTTPYECVADAKSAIRWVRAHAGELGVDPSRIVACGGSAGGHLAACAGVIEGLDEKGEDLSVSSVPNALVLFNPALDTTAEKYQERLGPNYQTVSPLHHVRPGLPPTILFHGERDETVPYQQATDFCAAMKENGNRCELVGFEGEGHGFFNFGRGGEKAFRETLKAADRFLASLGYLKGEPTLE